MLLLSYLWHQTIRGWSPQKELRVWKCEVSLKFKSKKVKKVLSTFPPPWGNTVHSMPFPPSLREHSSFNAIPPSLREHSSFNAQPQWANTANCSSQKLRGMVVRTCWSWKQNEKYDQCKLNILCCRMLYHYRMSFVYGQHSCKINLSWV